VGRVFRSIGARSGRKRRIQGRARRGRGMCGRCCRRVVVFAGGVAGGDFLLVDVGFGVLLEE